MANWVSSSTHTHTHQSTQRIGDDRANDKKTTKTNQSGTFTKKDLHDSDLTKNVLCNRWDRDTTQFSCVSSVDKTTPNIRRVSVYFEVHISCE